MASTFLRFLVFKFIRLVFWTIFLLAVHIDSFSTPLQGPRVAPFFDQKALPMISDETASHIIDVLGEWSPSYSLDSPSPVVVTATQYGRKPFDYNSAGKFHTDGSLGGDEFQNGTNPLVVIANALPNYAIFPAQRQEGVSQTLPITESVKDNILRTEEQSIEMEDWQPITRAPMPIYAPMSVLKDVAREHSSQAHHRKKNSSKLFTDRVVSSLPIPSKDSITKRGVGGAIIIPSEIHEIQSGAMESVLKISHHSNLYESSGLGAELNTHTDNRRSELILSGPEQLNSFNVNISRIITDNGLTKDPFQSGNVDAEAMLELFRSLEEAEVISTTKTPPLLQPPFRITTSTAPLTYDEIERTAIRNRETHSLALISLAREFSKISTVQQDVQLAVHSKLQPKKADTSTINDYSTHIHTPNGITKSEKEREVTTEDAGLYAHHVHDTIKAMASRSRPDSSLAINKRVGYATVNPNEHANNDLKSVEISGSVLDNDLQSLPVEFSDIILPLEKNATLTAVLGYLLLGIIEGARNLNGIVNSLMPVERDVKNNLDSLIVTPASGFHTLRNILRFNVLYNPDDVLNEFETVLKLKMSELEDIWDAIIPLIPLEEKASLFRKLKTFLTNLQMMVSRIKSIVPEKITLLEVFELAKPYTEQIFDTWTSFGNSLKLINIANIFQASFNSTEYNSRSNNPMNSTVEDASNAGVFDSIGSLTSLKDSITKTLVRRGKDIAYLKKYVMEILLGDDDPETSGLFGLQWWSSPFKYYSSLFNASLDKQFSRTKRSVEAMRRTIVRRSIIADGIFEPLSVIRALYNSLTSVITPLQLLKIAAEMPLFTKSWNIQRGFGIISESLNAVLRSLSIPIVTFNPFGLSAEERTLRKEALLREKCKKILTNLWIFKKRDTAKVEFLIKEITQQANALGCWKLGSTDPIPGRLDLLRSFVSSSMNAQHPMDTLQVAKREMDRLLDKTRLYNQQGRPIFLYPGQSSYSFYVF